MTRLENLCYDPKWISKYLPKIIWYLPLVDSSMWHFHVTIFVALNSGRQNSTFTFFEVVNFLDCIFHVVFVVLICLSLYVSLTIKIVELIQLSNSIWNFLHSAHPIQVFIHPCGIGEYWLFLVFALLVGSERFGSTLHYFIVLIILFFLFSIWYFLPCSRSRSESPSEVIFWHAQIEAVNTIGVAILLWGWIFVLNILRSCPLLHWYWGRWM